MHYADDELLLLVGRAIDLALCHPGLPGQHDILGPTSRVPSSCIASASCIRTVTHDITVPP